MSRLFRDFERYNIGKKIDGYRARRTALWIEHKLSVSRQGDICLDNVPEELADEIKKKMDDMGVECLCYFREFRDEDILYDIVIVLEDFSLSKRKEILKAFWALTEPIWSQYNIFEMVF